MSEHPEKKKKKEEEEEEEEEGEEEKEEEEEGGGEKENKSQHVGVTKGGGKGHPRASPVVIVLPVARGHFYSPAVLSFPLGWG